ncbi:MAG: MtrB/PioB family outer membrane beta-barrel protein [Bacteroidales bacterium]
MKRTIVIAALLAMALLMAAPFAAAQTAAAQKDPAPAPPQQVPASPMTPIFPGPAVATPSTGGSVSLMLFGASTIDSAKFEEYRQIPKGVSMPSFNVFASNDKIDFNLVGQKVFQTDQRYTGWANFAAVGVSFDYNQIPHNMGNNGTAIHNETAPGVWSMSTTVRQSLSDTVDKTASSARTYPFYQGLFAPVIAAGNSVDIVQERKHGAMDIDLGQKLPFGLNFTYVRDVKTGSRGASGGDILSLVTMSPDVPEPVNEVTQDFGFRWGYNRKMANVYAAFNRNLYNDRIDSLIVDNPLRATNSPYTGGTSNPAQVRFGTPPDNSANRFAFGGAYKAAHQTRLSGDFAFGTWSQDAQFLPATINDQIVTSTGQAANSLSILPQQSLNGKINTTMVNLGFSSRPVTGLGVRVRYRLYDMANKTPDLNWGDASGASSPDRSWVPDEPDDFATGVQYSAKTQRFDVQAGYDYKALTIEGSLHHATIDRTFREAASDSETGYGAAAVFHAKDWLGFRGFINHAHRTPHDAEVNVWGLQADEAERNRNVAGIEFDITPTDVYGVSFTYSRRHDDYPNRPLRLVVGGVGVPTGLLDAAYDAFTVEFNYTPGDRAEFNVFYTYEKNTAANQRVFTQLTGQSTADPATSFYNVLPFNQSDKGNTFGADLVYHIVPDKWDVLFSAQRQKVDGLMAIPANNQTAGTVSQSFYQSRTANGFSGPQDITDFDDTALTTVLAQLNRTIAKVWTLSVGYAYEQYDFADAFTSAPENLPLSVLYFLKANNGAYKASMGFARLAYRF